MGAGRRYGLSRAPDEAGRVSPRSVEEVVRSGQIVIGGLMGGLLCFAAVAVALAPVSDSPDPQLGALMVGALTVLAAGCALGYRVMRRSMLQQLRARAAEMRQERDPAGPIVNAYQGFVIQGGGLIEGPGLFALVIYLVTGHPVALGAAGLALVLLALHLPSEAKLRRLAEESIHG